MRMFDRRSGRSVFVCFLLAVAQLLIAAALGAAQTGHRRFTVVDDIGLSQFQPDLVFSPDDRFFIVVSDRGRVELNRAESTLRVYSTEDIRKLLSEPEAQQEPSPLWSISKSTYTEGPIISNVRWLYDSSGFMFLAKTESGNDQLFLANPHAKTVKPLTGEDQSVRGFAVRSENQFVYAVPSPTIKQKVDEDERAGAFVGTGQDLTHLMFPQLSVDYSDLSELWAVVDGKRFRVVDASSQRPVPVHWEGYYGFALSPDGHSLATAMTIPTIPPEWETLYPPPTPSSDRVRAGRQDPDALNGFFDFDEYALIDLTSGRVKPIVHAPTGYHSGWGGITTADWSADGKSVVMSETFLQPGTQHTGVNANRPCVAVADISSGKLTCVERCPEQTEEDRKEKWLVFSASFVSGKSDRVIVRYALGGSTTYLRSADGSWSADGPRSESASEPHAIDVQVKQDLNKPPVLIATDKQGKNSRRIWDPNPQLKDVQLRDVEIFKWRYKDGRDWNGGLYKPPDFIQGKRYPLVIQTHGFDEHAFLPSGAFSSAFAAQELAAMGFVVLQLNDCPLRNREEAACQVAGYEAAVQTLANEGLVDPDRVGIVGFSRTCLYVMQALTTSTLHFKAASITSGVNHGYLQYLTWADISSTAGDDAEAGIGARPFGSGLQQWLRRSPEFNMDKVQTPLQVVAEGRRDVLTMWEPYAALRYLNRPVDLLVLGSDQHVLTNPAARMASQGGTVDWFRFWLTDEEDPDPAKAAQYARWRKMREQQIAASHAKEAEISSGR